MSRSSGADVQAKHRLLFARGRGLASFIGPPSSRTRLVFRGTVAARGETLLVMATKSVRIELPPSDPARALKGDAAIRGDVTIVATRPGFTVTVAAHDGDAPSGDRIMGEPCEVFAGDTGVLRYVDDGTGTWWRAG